MSSGELSSPSLDAISPFASASSVEPISSPWPGESVLRVASARRGSSSDARLALLPGPPGRAASPGRLAGQRLPEVGSRARVNYGPCGRERRPPRARALFRTGLFSGGEERTGGFSALAPRRRKKVRARKERTSERSRARRARSGITGFGTNPDPMVSGGEAESDLGGARCWRRGCDLVAREAKRRAMRQVRAAHEPRASGRASEPGGQGV